MERPRIIVVRRQADGGVEEALCASGSRAHLEKPESGMVWDVCVRSQGLARRGAVGVSERVWTTAKVEFRRKA